MKAEADRNFWQCYARLTPELKRVAKKQFKLWRADHHHPSLQFKRIGDQWSARVSGGYRALGWIVDENTIVWHWIGPHDEYMLELKRNA